MKPIVYILFLYVWASFGCNGFLDEDPKSLITPEDYFLVDTDPQSAVDAIYTHLHGASVFANYSWAIQELASDNGLANGANPDLYEFSNLRITPQNSILEQIWSEYYSAINTSNFAIENIPNAPISLMEMTPLIAEARFFRGWFYFDLVRMFGEIPLMTLPNTNLDQEFNTPRMPLDTVYKQVIADLTFAFENLPTKIGTGRPSRYAAMSLLAKLYLTIKNNGRAFGFARAVVQSGAFSLEADYADVFKVSKNNGSEIIFSLNYSKLDPAPFNKRTLPKALGGQARELPHPALVDVFNPLDRRLSVSFIDSYIDNSGNTVSIPTHVSKFWDRSVEPNAGLTANDLPLIRYADLLLVYAEAINEVRRGSNAEALAAINAVRARARFDGTANQNILPALGAMAYEDFKAAILEERRRELAWEGHRWFDLVRFGTLEASVLQAKPGSNVSETHKLFPIPQREIEKNPNLAPQNPGY